MVPLEDGSGTPRPGTARGERVAPEVLVIFARRPVPGLVKTRLARGIGGATAAALYRCFVTDLAGRFPATPARATCFAVAPPADGFAEDLGVDPVACFAQSGPDLGARMHAALRQVLGSPGRRACVLVGSDLPHLDPRSVDAAFAALAGPVDLVLGPAEDGGYYLVGMSRALDVFSGVPWSTSGVLAATRARAAELGLRVVELEPAFDVDEPADLERLRRRLHGPVGAGPACPATAAFLRGLPA